MAWSNSGFVPPLTNNINDLFKLSKIIGCKLERVADLSFNFTGGSCNSFENPEPRILICFGNESENVFDNEKLCQTWVLWFIIENYKKISFDGQNFFSAGSSKYAHGGTFGMPNYRGKALTTGCHSKHPMRTCGIKTELMDMASLQWSDGPDFLWGD